jgi:hypothetical protein
MRSSFVLGAANGRGIWLALGLSGMAALAAGCDVANDDVDPYQRGIVGDISEGKGGGGKEGGGSKNPDCEEFLKQAGLDRCHFCNKDGFIEVDLACKAEVDGPAPGGGGPGPGGGGPGPLVGGGGNGGGGSGGPVAGDGHDPNVVPFSTEEAINTFATTVGFPAPNGWRYRYHAPDGYFGRVIPSEKTIFIYAETFAEDAAFFKAILAHENTHLRQCFAHPYRLGAKVGPSNFFIDDGNHLAAGLVNQLEAYDAELAYIQANHLSDHPVNRSTTGKALEKYVQSERDFFFAQLASLRGSADYQTRVGQGNYTLKPGDARSACPDESPQIEQ